MERNEKIWESVIVIVLIGIIICLLTPIVQAIIFTSKVSSTETSAENLVNTVEILYAKASMSTQVSFPFIVIFDKGNYTIYSQTEKNIINETINFEGKLPDAGAIIRYNNGTMSASNLTFGDVICNQRPNNNMKCKRS